ncbi:MAG TPA: substrate-binding domain-containing protein, partial [Ktedonobacteraceae bacterium]|nr:substrate-binding domain-containing protein [Ktedonobacteraceae bacterium]
GILLFFAASPFHLENLPFSPIQNLGQSGGFRVNPTGGVTPTTVPSPVTSGPPQSGVNREGAPTSRGHVTPTSGVTPSPTVSITATPDPGGTTTASSGACASGTLSIDGSPYLEPALRQVNTDYNALCPGLQIVLGGDGSRALNLAQHGRVDIADSDLTAQPAHQLTDHPLAALLYSLIVSPDNALTGLSSAQIQAIFQGQITNWAQLGGQNEAITVILPPPSSAIFAIFRAFVLHGAPLQVNAIVFRKDQPSQVAQLVSQTPGAISFVPLAMAMSAPVQMLAIDGAPASTQTLLDGTYAFWSIEHLYTLGVGTAQAQSYIQFATSSQEMNLLSRFGAAPLNTLDPAILQSHVPGPQF